MAFKASLNAEIMNVENFDDDSNVEEFLFQATGYRYELAASSGRCWGHEENSQKSGTFYHIMGNPDDGGFFRWYKNERMYYQFFSSKELAMLYFLKYWIKWKELNND